MFLDYRLSCMMEILRLPNRAHCRCAYNLHNHALISAVSETMPKPLHNTPALPFKNFEKFKIFYTQYCEGLFIIFGIKNVHNVTNLSLAHTAARIKLCSERSDCRRCRHHGRDTADDRLYPLITPGTVGPAAAGQTAARNVVTSLSHDFCYVAVCANVSPSLIVYEHHYE